MMHYHSQIKGIKETDKGTDLIVHIPGEKIKSKILKFRNGKAINSEIRIDDNRHISAEQRKKIYAILKDIANYLGDWPEYYKQFLKFEFCSQTGQEWFSLSNCTMTTARLFINFLIEFCFTHDIPTLDTLLNRTDDVNSYLYMCIKHKKCAICNKKAEIHHWDAIGMGRDRTSIDDSNLRKIALCTEHHLEAHTIGRDSFKEKYHVYGIIYNENK